MDNTLRTLVIAAPMSGSGKTMVTLGLMEAFGRKGLAVAPFKVGPDFIDPGWHRLVTGRPSINLDGWMCPEGFVRDTFALHARGCDLAVVEGVMGLFDGMDADSDAGSTAQVARILDAPVILVVDAKSQARSAAALVRGFAGFDRQVRVAGVIFNNVGSDNHARVLRESVEGAVPEVRVLGCIPRDQQLSIPSRHLGLVTAEENPLPDDFRDRLAATIREHIDLEGLLSVPQSLWGQVSIFDTGLVKCRDLTRYRKSVSPLPGTRPSVSCTRTTCGSCGRPGRNLSRFPRSATAVSRPASAVSTSLAATPNCSLRR